MQRIGWIRVKDFPMHTASASLRQITVGEWRYWWRNENIMWNSDLEVRSKVRVLCWRA